jgi:hypothetical protein
VPQRRRVGREERQELGGWRRGRCGVGQEANGRHKADRGGAGSERVSGGDAGAAAGGKPSRGAGGLRALRGSCWSVDRGGGAGGVDRQRQWCQRC